jgi:hypothetical protein
MGTTPSYGLSAHRRTTADEAQDLHSITLFQTSVIEVLPVHDFQVQLHRDTLGLNGKLTQQIPYSGVGSTAPLLAVHLNLNRIFHFLYPRGADFLMSINLIASRLLPRICDHVRMHTTDYEIYPRA